MQSDARGGVPMSALSGPTLSESFAGLSLEMTSRAVVQVRVMRARHITPHLSRIAGTTSRQLRTSNSPTRGKIRLVRMDLTNMRIAYVSRHRGGSQISPSYEKSSRQFS